MPKPSIAVMRARTQPESIMGRPSAEHWVGRLWTRRVSVYVTRSIIDTRLTPNLVTLLMILVGLLGAAGLAFGGVTGAALAVLGIQLYLLADCVDGELARWRGVSSMRGAYLDRVGHYVVEAALLGMYGFHISGSWSSGWSSLGLAVALIAILTKSQTDLVPRMPDARWNELGYDAVVTPKPAAVRRLRRVVHPLRVHRLTGAAEASLAMLVAALIRAAGWDSAEKALLLLFAVVAVGLFFGHGLAIWTSPRLDIPDPDAPVDSRRGSSEPDAETSASASG